MRKIVSLIIAGLFIMSACQVQDALPETETFGETELSAILQRGGFHYDKNSNTFRGHNITLDANAYAKHGIGDNIHSMYSVKVVENDPQSFSNLVIEPLTIGHRMYVQQYTFEGSYTGMDSFTGNVSRKNLDGTVFNQYGFVNGEVSARTSANAKEAMCVVGVYPVTVCVKMVKYNALGDERCVQYATYDVIVMEECGDDSPPVDDGGGYTPPAGGSGGGGNYVPPGNPVSGPGTPGGTPPVDDGSVNGGNNPVPIPGYKPQVPIVDDGEAAGVMSPWAAKHVTDKRLAQCMKEVFNNIKNINQGDVGKVIQRFNSNPSEYDWEVRDAVLPSGINAQTEWDATNKRATTKFDNSKFSSASNLAMARTMLHEAIHAYVVATQWNTISDLAKKQELLGPGWTIANLNQNHDYIATHYLQPIADALKEYGTCMGYNLPDQFYKDLAWGGLAMREDTPGVETDIFKQMVPNAADRERIRNVINIEQSGRDIKGQTQPQKGKPSSCLAK